MQNIRRWSLFALVAGGLFFTCGRPLRAQQLELEGRVLGPAGEGVADHAVLLHRVTQGGGALLARSTTDSAGRFTIRATTDGAAEGVYFVATRYEGELYIGPMRRPPFEPSDEYIVQVGIPGVGDINELSAASASADEPLTRMPGGASTTASGLAFGLALLLTTIAVGAYLSIRGTGPSKRRRALIRIAELDERSGGELTAEQLRTRNHLVRRVTREAG